MNASPRGLVAVALLVAAGCAPAARFHPEQFDVAPRFREAPADSPSTAPAPEAFWSTFGDPALTRLVTQALSANQEIQVAETRVRAARAERLASAMALVPTFTAEGGYTRQRMAAAMVPGASGTLPDQDLWNAGLGVSWEVDVFGRNRRALQARSAFVGAAQEDLRDIQVLLAAEVASAYLELRGVEERLLTARENAENQRRTVALTVQRLEAGRGNALDVDRAQAQLSSTLSAIPALEGAVAALQYRLSLLLGRTPGEVVAPLAGTAGAPVLPGALPVLSPEALIRQRPDVRSAERRLAARRTLVGAARADYLPRLSVVGSAGYTAPAASALGEDGTSRYAVGPVVSWAILDLGRVQAGVDAARAGRDEAQARYEQTVLRALGEVETSLVTYRKARERLQYLDDAAAASARASWAARDRFQEGASDFLQVLDAERTLLEAQDRQAAGRTDASTGLVAAYRALGGSWAAPSGGAE